MERTVSLLVAIARKAVNKSAKVDIELRHKTLEFLNYYCINYINGQSIIGRRDTGYSGSPVTNSITVESELQALLSTSWSKLHDAEGQKQHDL